MTPLTSAIRPAGLAVRRLGWRISYGILDPAAYEFYSNITGAGYDPTKTLDVVPEARVIYVSVPKAASTAIKKVLSRCVSGDRSQSPEAAHNRKLSGLRAPHHVGLSRFYRLALDPSALRFAFVRNPYARLVSCWSDKFKDKPLAPDDPFAKLYLAWCAATERTRIPTLGACLPFGDFVRFACQTATRLSDPHWQLQSFITSVPGLALDFVGKVERFDKDFMVVFRHLNLNEGPAPLAANTSSHRPWVSYYTSELASTVYRTYEQDFDQFAYPRALIDR